MAKGSHNNTESGKKGEAIAAQWLESNGFEIKERNFRSGKGEIDLIAQKGLVLVFVEVKLRTSTNYGFPEKAVTLNKAKKLKDTALAYLELRNWKGPIRFDIIAITQKVGKVEIMAFEDAF